MPLNELRIAQGQLYWFYYWQSHRTRAEVASGSLSNRSVFPESDVEESLGALWMSSCWKLTWKMLWALGSPCFIRTREQFFMGLWPNLKEPLLILTLILDLLFENRQGESSIPSSYP